MGITTPWTSDEPLDSSFALPSGLRGRFAGRMLLWTSKQQDVLDLLDVQAGESVLEIGYGPGGLIRLLQQTPAGRICGVDPSPEMRDLAVRGRRAEVAAGRIDLRLGAAEHTGFAEADFDCVVAVNNVAIWPDIGAGLYELHRVTRPGGRLVIAWHGGTRPSRIDRSQQLPEHQLAVIERELSARFVKVTRQELPTHTAFIAIR